MPYSNPEAAIAALERLHDLGAHLDCGLLTDPKKTHRRNWGQRPHPRRDIRARVIEGHIFSHKPSALYTACLDVDRGTYTPPDDWPSFSVPSKTEGRVHHYVHLAACPQEYTYHIHETETLTVEVRLGVRCTLWEPIEFLERFQALDTSGFNIVAFGDLPQKASLSKGEKKQADRTAQAKRALADAVEAVSTAGTGTRRTTVSNHLLTCFGWCKSKYLNKDDVESQVRNAAAHWIADDGEHAFDSVIRSTWEAAHPKGVTDWEAEVIMFDDLWHSVNVYDQMYVASVDSPRYRPIDPAALDALLTDTSYRDRADPRHVRTAGNFIVNRGAVPMWQIDNATNPLKGDEGLNIQKRTVKQGCLGFTNGYVLSDDPETVHDYDPLMLVPNRLPYAYTPDTQVPELFTETLHGWFSDEKARTAFLELIGLLASGDMDWVRVWSWYGGSQSGKTTALLLFAALFGNDLYQGLTASNLANTHGFEPLSRCTIVGIDDTAINDLQSDAGYLFAEAIRSASGRAPMQVNPKGRKMFTTYPRTRFVFTSVEPMTLRGDAASWRERGFFLNFGKTRPVRERKTTLVELLKPGYGAILAKGLRHYATARLRGQLTEPQYSHDLRNDQCRESKCESLGY